MATAAPSGHGAVYVGGPAGVVTDHGPIGPAGHGILGGVGVGAVYGTAAHGAVIAGPAVAAHGVGAILTPPSAHAVISGPAPVHAAIAAPALVAGHGVYGAGWGYGGGWAGGWAGEGAHVGGVVVKGPPTVPATIAGPSGKIHATGLWGPTLAHGHGGWGHHY